jgi:peptide/nickel transport system substrate-binding protein
MNGFRSLGIAAIALLFALISAVSAQQAEAGEELIIGVDQEAIGMDPNIVTSFSSHRRVELLYNRLVRYDENANVVPDLAESWEIPDPTTYVFHLRQGVTVHNGREFTADDVKYTIERILDPETASPARSFLVTVEEVVVQDPYTVEIRLSEPTASLLDALAHANTSVVPQEEVEEHGDLQRTAVGTGPFMLENWIPDQEMVLVRNPDYFEAGLPHLERITVRVIPEQTSLLAGLRTGSLQAALITEGSVRQLAERDPNLSVLSTPSLNMRTYGFNTTREPFDDARVRQAIALALDRQQIIQAAELGFGQVTAPMPSSAREWAAPVEELPNYQTDLERASAIAWRTRASSKGSRVVLKP